MITDLARPLVGSRGAHDPLDGLICAYSILAASPDRAGELEDIIGNLNTACRDRNWTTIDHLGVCGLLLNGERATVLNEKFKLPDSVDPGKLLLQAITGLEMISNSHDPNQPARERLPF